MDINSIDTNSAQFVIGKAIVEDITKTIFTIFRKYETTMDVENLANVIELQTKNIADQLKAKA